MFSREVICVVRIQSVLTLCITALCALFVSYNSAVSALMGGVLAVVPALLYALIAYRIKRAHPQVLLKEHFRAESVKMLSTLILFALVILLFRGVSAPSLFAGYIAAQSAYLISLLFK